MTPTSQPGAAVQAQPTGDDFVAYDYDAQRFVRGVEAAQLRMNQLRKERALVGSSHGEAYLRFLTPQVSTPPTVADALTKIDAGIAACAAYIAGGERHA